MTTHVLNFQLQLLLRSVASALSPLSVSNTSRCGSIESYLKGQMFQEVSRSIGPICLCSRSSIDPHTNSRGLCPWRMLGGDLKTSAASRLSAFYPYRQSIGQCGGFRLHAIFHHWRREPSLQWCNNVEGSAIAQSLRKVQS